MEGGQKALGQISKKDSDAQNPTKEPLLQEESVETIYPEGYSAEHGLRVPMSAVWMVYLAIFMDHLGGQISSPSMPYYVKSFGVGNEYVGYLASVFQLMGIFCGPILGLVSDRFGRRTVILISVLGAGVASLSQGYAPSLLWLFVMRAFGGVWGAVMPVAKVYIADVCHPTLLADYMAYAATIPGAAQTFGPGFGGGLTVFGLNAPLLVDGVVSLLIAVLVYFYLPESPAWLASKTSPESGDKPRARNASPIPMSAYGLASSGLFFWMGMISTNSMMPIVLHAKFKFDPIHVGYTLTVIAVMRLVAGIWIARPVQKLVGMNYASGGGAFVTGAFLIAGVYVDNMWVCIACLGISKMASNVRTSANGALSASVTTVENRSKIFSVVNSFQSFGKFVGPMIAGYLADVDATAGPLLFGGFALLVSGILDMTLKPGSAQVSHPVARVPSYEEGSAEDHVELGKYVANLLKTRHYKWISDKDRVYSMLDKVIPELRSDGKERDREFDALLHSLEGSSTHL